jgi:5-(carboxyamino)imidazole ribonucleotide mutase
MAKAADILTEMGIEYEMRIISAHRVPDVLFAYAKGAEERGIKVMIAGAGMAAHLPGVCAALFKLPVIGVPILSNTLAGHDALHSIVQMPPGIPVATVAINGALNAGLLAAQILATSDAGIRARLQDYTDNMQKTIKDKDARLQEVGYKEY